MEYSEFRRHLGKAGLTVNEYSMLVEVRPNSISNYSKKSSVPRKHAILAVVLGELADRKVDFRELLERFNLRTSKPRINLRIASLDEFRNRRSGKGGLAPKELKPK